ncbi:hypothetical protein NW765_002667 [Fusarium oxysporum]|nr:hypothetical protein NW765_002667 [Fusarium oxysporum]KAJ4278408.1 hypothetical protein NW764_007213 [Fusarium oxysporum]
MIMAVESPNRSCDDDSRELGSEPLFLAHPSTHPLSLEWDLEWWPFCREKVTKIVSASSSKDWVSHAEEAGQASFDIHFLHLPKIFRALAAWYPSLGCID